jgi:hypothetical protein
VYAAVGIIFIAGFTFVVPLCIPLVVKNESYYATFVFMGAIASGFATRGLYHYFLLKILYLKKTKLLTLAFALSAAVQIPVTILFANRWALDGVIWASIISKAAQALFLYLVVRPYFKIHLNPWKLIVLPVVFIAGSVYLWYASDQYHWYWYAMLFAATTLFVFVIYRKEIMLTAGKFLKR